MNLKIVEVSRFTSGFPNAEVSRFTSHFQIT